MATALTKLGPHLECHICQDRYKQPKVLNCLHSFCEKCLETYYTSRYNGEAKIPCPVCRRDTVLPQTRIRGLKTNFHLMGIVEEVSLQEKVASSVKGTPEGESKCPKHKGETTWFYCETCQELICRVCTVVDHRGPQHRYIDSKEASVKYKQSLKDNCLDLAKDITELQLALAKSSKAEKDFTQRVATTLKAVKDKAHERRAEITTQETKMTNEIEQLQQTRRQTYSEHRKVLERMLQSKQYSLRTSQDIIDTASVGDFLSLYPIITKDFESLTGERPPLINSTLSYLSFVPAQGTEGTNLGKLEVAPAVWTRCGKFGKAGGLKIDCAQGITATQPGEIAVADRWNSRIVICSTRGQHKKTLAVQHPRALAVIHIPEPRLAVLDGTRFVKVYNLRGKRPAFHFPTTRNVDYKPRVKLRSVAVKSNGTILVGDVLRSVWTEHTPTNGQHQRTIEVRTPPHYLAVDNDTGRVVVSSRDGKNIDIVDSNGKILVIIQPTIDTMPELIVGGVCCDSSGIYVALQHIHHYDLQGRFIACLDQGLYGPGAITLTSEGWLVVADHKSVKMLHKV